MREREQRYRYCSGYTYPEEKEINKNMTESYTHHRDRKNNEREKKRIKKQTQTYQLFEKE